MTEFIADVSREKITRNKYTEPVKKKSRGWEAEKKSPLEEMKIRIKRVASWERIHTYSSKKIPKVTTLSR